MTITMNDDAITSIAHVAVLIKSAETLGVEALKRHDDMGAVYAWMNDTLLRLHYRKLGKKEKGLLRRYLYTSPHCLDSQWVS
jgi:hypothetical protein